MSTCLADLDSTVTSQNNQIYLIGDSIARNFLPTLISSFPEYNVTYYTSSSCSLQPLSSARRTSEDCVNYNTDIIQYIIKSV